MTSHRNKATSKWPRSSSFFSKPAFKCCAPLFDNITSIEPDRGELTLVGFSPAPQGCQHIHMMLPWPSLWAEVAYFTKSYTRLAMCSSTALPRTFSGIANHVPSSKFVCSEQMWAFRKCRVCETFQGATEGHRIFLWGQQQFWFQTGPSRKRICVIHTSLTSATCSTPSIIIEKCSKHFSPEAKCLLTPFPPQVSRSTHENWLGRSQAAGGTGRHHSAAASQKGGPFFGHPLSTDLSWRSQKWDRKTAPILRLFSAPWLTKRTSPEANFCSMHREKKGALRRRVFCCATVWTRHCRAATRACAACAAAAFGHGFAVCGNPSRDVFKAGGWLTPLHTDSLRRRRRSESCRA